MTTKTLLIALAALCLTIWGCHYFSTESQITYGLNHYEMGLYKQAIPPLISAAESLEKKSPPDPRLVDVLIALGNMAQSDKRDELAADFYPRALKAAEAVQPTDNTRLRNALVHTGMFYSYHKRAQEALPLLQRAAAISEKFDNREYHAIDLDNLALAHYNLKQYQQASELQLRALKVANELTSGRFLARTKGTILHNLGTSFIELGRNKEAEESFKQSIAVLTSAGSEVEPWRIETAKKSYAELLRKTGRAKEAPELEAPALQPGAPANTPRPAGSARR